MNCTFKLSTLQLTWNHGSTLHYFFFSLGLLGFFSFCFSFSSSSLSSLSSSSSLRKLCESKEPTIPLLLLKAISSAWL